MELHFTVNKAKKMTDTNLPWKYPHLKYFVGYRKWEAIKYFKNQNQKRKLLTAFESGKKVLFIHIPKTAGITLIRSYEDYFTDARHMQDICKT